MDEFAYKVRWYVRIRWYFLLTLGLTGIGAQLFSEGLTTRAIRNLFGVIAALSVNGIFYLILKKPRGLAILRSVAFSQLAFDILLATYIIVVQGGVESRTVILYAIPIIASGAILGKTAIYIASFASALFYSLVLLGDYLGYIRFGDIRSPHLHGDTTFFIQSIVFYSSVFVVLGSIAHYVTEQLTKQKQALEDSTAALNDAQKIANMGSWQWDITSGSVSWSEGLYQLFGIDKKTSKTTDTATYLTHVHPEDKETVNAAINEALKHSKNFEIKHRITKPDGTERIVRAQGSIAVDGLGKPIKMVGVIEDVTDKELAEKELLAQRNELQKINNLMVGRELKMAELKRDLAALRKERGKT